MYCRKLVRFQMNTHRKLYICFIFIVFPQKVLFPSTVVTAQPEPMYGLYANFYPYDELLYPMDDTDEEDPREGPYFQGDILNPPDERAVTPIKSRRWLAGAVMYVIDKIYTKEGVREIEQAMYEIEEKTSYCVQFMYWYNDTYGDPGDYVHITWEDKGCFSAVGRFGGRQLLNLEAPICFRDRNIIVHELLHAIGFYHEQSRRDRDQYVGINWSNIKKEDQYNFKKLYTEDYGVPYDYESIMHYNSKAFAVDKSEYTVYTKKPEGGDHVTQMERRRINAALGKGGLSEGDIKQIRRFYGCEPT